MVSFLKKPFLFFKLFFGLLNINKNTRQPFRNPKIV